MPSSDEIPRKGALPMTLSRKIALSGILAALADSLAERNK